MENLYISTTFIPDGNSVSNALEICENNGVDKVELGSNHKYEVDFNSILTSYHFSYLIHNYFPVPSKEIILNIASHDNEIRKMSISHIYRSIKFCKDIDAKLYTFHPGFINDPLIANKDSENYDFVWDNILTDNNYQKAFHNMLNSIDLIVNYAQQNNIKIAIETEGSYHKKSYLLMQAPVEYEKFIDIYRPSDIGINLNVGHLNLASNAYNFDKELFIKIIEKYIVAFELSHNNGFFDQHLPLKENGYYWDFIFRKEFETAYKILEFRNIDITTMKNNIDMFNKMKKSHNNEISIS